MIASPIIPIGAIIARARRKIVAHFFVQHAVSAEEAVAFVPDRHVMHREFARMQSRGIVREASAGRYWIDTVALQADADRRRRILVPIVIIVAVLAAVILMLAGYQG
ncbi:MAG: hypothetical protein KF730_03950 [Sphingomonas sp.]|uniref:hypothetical protein n=1 Tax=Sphingomonas sp. TaxID=28214 RepID=UPI0025F44BA5|nr:hypothetical protein [Sphingomonas sp.]MBX3563712.1 hypothetical protein [Sphingomonas sp.]